MADVKAIADEIYNTVQKTIQEAKVVDSGNGFDIKDVRAILTAVDTVVTEVEKLSASDLFKGLTGEEKKEVATDVLSRLLSFDIPWVPNFLEKTVKEKAISFAIDYSVEWLNKKFGKEWLK